MDAETHALIEHRAQAIAARYTARAPWLRARREDLYQTAWLAMLDALPRFDASKGILEGYLWRAAVLAVHRTVFEYSAPVSSRHRASDLRGVTAHSVSNEDESAQFVCDDETFDAVQRGEVRARVQQRLNYLFGENGVPFVLGVFGDGITSTDVAREHNIPVKRVWAIARRVREDILSDPELRDLWEQL